MKMKIILVIVFIFGLFTASSQTVNYIPLKDTTILDLNEVYPTLNENSNYFILKNAENLERVIISNFLHIKIDTIFLNNNNNSQKTVNINNLRNGIYLITFIFENNERIIKKMIKD